MDPGKSGIVTAASIQMRAVVITYGNDKIKGELYSRYLEAPYEFTSLVQMIEKMEEIFDAKGFPEKFMKPRSFGDGKQGTKKYDAERNDIMKDTLDSTLQIEPGGSKCTFEITVKFRQNATWQGQILWAEKNLKQNFRSVLEMLKLMDEALIEAGGKNEAVEWDA